MMCCAVTVTAFAATPDEAPAKDMQAIIKQAMLDNYYTDTKPTELEIRIVGGNENGSVYFEHTDNLSYTSAAMKHSLATIPTHILQLMSCSFTTTAKFTQ